MTIPLQDLAARLDDAVLNATAIRQLTTDVELTLEEAYAVQRAGVALRAERADCPVGVKLGFTSKAKAAQMGVSDVILGTLTESMQVEDGGTLDCARLIHPRIEPEVAFRLGRDVDPDDPASDPLIATTEVAPAVEVIDSRYRNFTFSLQDVVADNASAAGFALGPWRTLHEVRDDLANTAVVLEIDGHIAETGSTAAILGDPLRALAAVKRLARRHRLALPAGTIILAGAATAAAPLQAGSVIRATVAGLGQVTMRTDKRLG
ncbi:2-keto-4-pentenoate hydratase [Nonomuraea sp. NPDC051941]|uniref:2-keto-4-pentenoate hydratase n=1 Tax=Nonomuraea sp. NPDC051941 TaxID=3364373 RepID=UPI0037C8FF09